MQAYKYVVLGGGVVAGYAAREFAAQGVESNELCIVSADSALPYERPPLSKGYLMGQEELEEILINDASFYEEHGIKVRLETPVERVDLEQKRLYTATGQEIGFDKLLIATGSRLRTLDLPGAELEGLYYLRWIEDARRLRARVEKARQAIVIGGGFIGMEVAARLAAKEIETTMLFPKDQVMDGLFTPHMADFFQNYYRERGVTFIPRARVESFAGDGQISQVVLRSGQELPADLVVGGIGVEPATDLFQETELELENGIVVNEYLETNVADVYAAGDVVNYRDLLFDKHRHIEHWDNAARQGQHATRVLLGEREPYKKAPYFFSDVFDLSWEFWGDTDGADWVLHRGAVQEGRFSVWWLQERRVVAAFVMNRPEEERELAPQWIEQGHRVSPARMTDVAQSLS